MDLLEGLPTGLPENPRGIDDDIDPVQNDGTGVRIHPGQVAAAFIASPWLTDASQHAKPVLPQGGNNVASEKSIGADHQYDRCIAGNRALVDRALVDGSWVDDTPDNGRGHGRQPSSSSLR